MQFKARGDDLTAAIDSMLQSNRYAAEVFSRYNVSACTDVTGFGLAGHLQEMLGSELGAAITTTHLPILAGAKECIEAGITSSLHASNIATAGIAGVLPQIMYDPQTSGGLLAGIPMAETEACLAALKEAGCEHASLIGVVDENPGLWVN